MAHRSDTVTGRFESLEEIQETKGLIDDLKALISPARALIPEVVSTIFEFCVSTQGKLPTPNPSKAPLLLIQISADWRRIALATPKVYSSLFICTAIQLTISQIWRSILLQQDINRDVTASVPRIEKQTLILQNWLPRSGTVPIFCHIRYSGRGHWYFNNQDKKRFHAALEHLVSVLVTHMSRWRNIQLELPFGDLSNLFSDGKTVSNCEAPMLKDFILRHSPLELSDPWNPWGQPTAGSSRTFVFPPSPKFHALTIDVPSFVLKSLRLPWTQLEEISFIPSPHRKSELYTPNNYLALGDVLHLLGYLHNLKRLTLAIGTQSHPLPNQPAVLSKLQKLSIFAGPDQFIGFFRGIILHKLERLIINKDWDKSTLVTFLSESTHPLKELSLVRIKNISDDDLFGCLQLVPSITHLHVTSPMGVGSLGALTPSKPAGDELACMCPNIEKLELRCWRPFNALVDVIERRWRSNMAIEGVARLKRVRLHLHCWPHKKQQAFLEEVELLARMQECKDQGLDIKWQL